MPVKDIHVRLRFRDKYTSDMSSNGNCHCQGPE